MKQSILKLFVLAFVSLAPAAALAQTDGGTDGAAEIDSGRPDYPILQDDGGRAWACALGHEGSPVSALPLLGLALALGVRRARR